MDGRNTSTGGEGQFIRVNRLCVLLVLHSSIDVEIEAVGGDKRRKREQEDGVDRLHECALV